MFCQKCGREIPDGSEFCGKCGTKAGESGASRVVYVVKETRKHDTPILEPKERARIIAAAILYLFTGVPIIASLITFASGLHDSAALLTPASAEYSFLTFLKIIVIIIGIIGGSVFRIFLAVCVMLGKAWSLKVLRVFVIVDIILGGWSLIQALGNHESTALVFVIALVVDAVMIHFINDGLLSISDAVQRHRNNR